MKIDTRSQLATDVGRPHGIIHLCLLRPVRWIFNANAFSFTRCLHGLYFIAVDMSECKKKNKIHSPEPDEWIDEYWVIFQHFGSGLPKRKMVSKYEKGGGNNTGITHPSIMDIIEFSSRKRCSSPIKWILSKNWLNASDWISFSTKLKN